MIFSYSTLIVSEINLVIISDLIQQINSNVFIIIENKLIIIIKLQVMKNSIININNIQTSIIGFILTAYTSGYLKSRAQWKILGSDCGMKITIEIQAHPTD